MKRILIPTDFSPHAEAAMAHAVGLAQAYDAELHLLNVQVPYGPTSPLLDEFPGESEARDALDALEVGTVAVKREMRRAIAVAPAVLEYADDNEIDLIVMGSHGRRGVSRLLLGSVTEEVIRAGRWPVLTVHEDAAERGDYDKILVPVDFSSRTASQVETATDIARRFGAALDVVHVIDPPTVPDLYMPIGPLAVDLPGTTARALEQMEELTQPLEAELTVTKDVLVGRAVHEIVERAEKGADLVVMPTHGYSGLDRVLIGSVAEGVLRRVQCPVLVLKPDEHADFREVAGTAGHAFA